MNQLLIRLEASRNCQKEALISSLRVICFLVIKAQLAPKDLVWGETVENSRDVSLCAAPHRTLRSRGPIDGGAFHTRPQAAKRQDMMDTVDDCIFCQIVRHQAPCHLVHETDQTLVFMDIFPVADGHTLVITKQHAETIYDASETALTAVAATARRVAQALRSVLCPDGLMVFQLNGAAAMQTVPHYHMHLLPRREGEPLALHTRVPGDPARLAELAARIGAAL